MIIPTRNRILIKKDTPDQMTKGGLILPEIVQDKDKKQTGTVLAAGPGITNMQGTFIPTSLVPGDKVIYSKYMGLDLKEFEDGLWLIPETDILAVVV